MGTVGVKHWRRSMKGILNAVPRGVLRLLVRLSQTADLYRVKSRNRQRWRDTEEVRAIKRGSVYAGLMHVPRALAIAK